MNVNDIMTLKEAALFTVNPGAHLSEAVIMMDQNDIGAVVVMDAEDVVGLVTFREVVAILARRLTERYAESPMAIADFFVHEAMGKNPPTTHPDMDVDELKQLIITSHARYVPVIDDTTLVSLMSLRDITNTCGSVGEELRK